MCVEDLLCAGDSALSETELTRAHATGGQLSELWPRPRPHRSARARRVQGRTHEITSLRRLPRGCRVGGFPEAVTFEAGVGASPGVGDGEVTERRICAPEVSFSQQAETP